MDAFYEEDERIVGHAVDSYHRIDIRRTSRPAGTSRAPTSTSESALTPAEGRTFCPYKGLASYYDIADAHRVAWSYEDAWTEVRRVSGLVSFEPDEIEVQLDGVRLRLEPGRNVVSHGADRNLTLDETTAVRQP